MHHIGSVRYRADVWLDQKFSYVMATPTPNPITTLRNPNAFRGLDSLQACVERIMARHSGKWTLQAERKQLAKTA